MAVPAPDGLDRGTTWPAVVPHPRKSGLEDRARIDHRHLNQVPIDTAYERSSIVLTTNLGFEQWTEILGPERLTGAPLDRLTHRGVIVETTGESYRLHDAKRRRRSETKS